MKEFSPCTEDGKRTLFYLNQKESSEKEEENPGSLDLPQVP
jgi:hypothetical protein